MAVMPMKKISIYGLKQDRKVLLEQLQRQSVVELSQSEIHDSDYFEKTDILPAKTAFESNQKTLQAALDYLDSLVKPKTSMFAMFEGRIPITVAQYKHTEDTAKETLKLANQILSLSKQVAEWKSDIVRHTTALEALTPWLSLDTSMRLNHTEYTSFFIGTFPESYTVAELYEAVNKELTESVPMEIEIVSADSQQTCVFVTCHRKAAEMVETALRSLGLTYPATRSKIPPAERAQLLQQRIEEAQKNIADAEQTVMTFAGKRDQLLYCHDYLTMRADKYLALGKLSQSNSTFIIDGYITAEDAEKTKQKLESRYRCFVELDDPTETDEIPVKLKNHSFVEPVEGVVESYSLPGKGEVDPTGIMAIFYYFMFGLMLSDLAYGLIMAIGCGVVLAKFKTMEKGLRNSVKMFMYCGISTAFWGLMFGSFFGDAIEVVSSTFFGVELATPTLWFRPLGDPMQLLMFSLLLGIIHLFTGLGIKFYMLVKQGYVKDAIYDVVFWYFLVGGAIIYFMSTQMFDDIAGLGFMLPVMVGNVGGVFAIIGAIGIVFTSGRSSKAPAIRFMKGLYGLYGATSYISDILSYSRLLALGLATGVIASVFNQMGAMMGASVVGAIVFIIVFILGHTLNIGLNVLGAYVHSNRLEFVEFFGKFYEGGGKKFEPFSANTKYFKIMEEQ